MLETEELDLVNVSTPDWMHFQHVKLALQLDCHVLVEKPMVRNLDEAKMMIDMVETSGKTLMVGQNYRRLPVAV
jgi:predicted dehydrogenase